jgi:signal peptidase II
MRKYLIFIVILAVCVTVDLATKTFAERHLASPQYEHSLLLDVPSSGTTVGEYLETELSWNSPEEVTEIANQFTFLLDDDGHPVRRVSSDTRLDGGERLEVQQRAITLIDGFLWLRYAENRGAAFSLLADVDPGLRQPLFIVVGLVAILFIGALFRSVKPERTFLITALALIVGGAIGNVVDRLRYGYVVDFIRCEPGFQWPTFNIADSLIVVGVGMMFIEVVRDHFRQRKAARTQPSTASAGGSSGDAA